MMNPGLKKIILAVLIVTFTVPAVFFSAPKEADAAAASCLMSSLGSLLGGGESAVSSVASTITAVPVSDKGVTINTSSTAANTATDAGANVGTNIGECLLKTLARIMAQAIIHNFSASVVDWINSGFHGSPSFVSNPEGFFADVGDQAAGQFIQGLGPIGAILCSPFDLQIRLALGLSLGVNGGRYQYVGCRLSDVQRNIYNDFTGGQWGAQGWQNWLSITAQPQNNAYGAYLYAEDSMTQQIMNQVGIRQQELQWGGGFLGTEKCSYQDPTDGSTHVMSNAEYKQYQNGTLDMSNGEIGTPTCATETPGSVISAQLNKTLGIPADVLSVSQDIDDIISALANQAITQVFSATGIAGMSQSGGAYTEGATYISTMMTSYQNQYDAGKILPPTGINCSLTYKTNSDGTVSVFNGQWEKNSAGNYVLDPSGNKTCVQNGTDPNANNSDPKECLVDSIIITVPKSTTALDFQNQITLGCQNINAAQPAITTINQLAAPGGALNPTGGEGTTPAPQMVNLAMGQDTSSSPPTDAGGPCKASYGVDGGTSNFSCNGLVLVEPVYVVGLKHPQSFWQVNLAKPSEIKYLKVSFRSDNTDQNFDNAFLGSSINFIDQNGTIIKTIRVNKPTSSYNSSDSEYIGDNGMTSSFLDNVTQFTGLTDVKSIKITKKNTRLSFTEFEAWGFSGNSGGSGVPAGPTFSSAKITSPNYTFPLSYNQSTMAQVSILDNSDALTVSDPSKAIPNLNIKVKLFKVIATGTTTVAVGSANGLAAVFDSFGIYRSVNIINPVNANMNDWNNLEPILAPAGFPSSLTPSTFYPSISYINDQNSIISPTHPPLFDSLTGILSAKLPQPVNPGTGQATGATTYHIKLGGNIRADAQPGTYNLVVEISESASPNLPVGTQTYTFTIAPSTG